MILHPFRIILSEIPVNQHDGKLEKEGRDPCQGTKMTHGPSTLGTSSRKSFNPEE